MVTPLFSQNPICLFLAVIQDKKLLMTFGVSALRKLHFLGSNLIADAKHLK